MSDRLFDLAVRDWLEDGSDRTPPPAIDAVLLAVKTTPQERDLWIPRRNHQMPNMLRLAALIAVAIVAVAGVLSFSVIGGPGSRPTGLPSPSDAVPTVGPTSTSAAVATLDPTTFATYTSARYGFSIGHPASWSEKPATRAWSFDTDSDATAPNSAGADHFTSSNSQVRVSAWMIPLEAGTPIDSRAAILAWVADYCARTGTAGCDGLVGRTTPFCNESRDCHAAVLVTFDDWVGLFTSGGSDTGNVLIVALWRSDDDPAVAPYGGARQLLTTVLGTMNIVPATDVSQLEGWPPPSPS